MNDFYKNIYYAQQDLITFDHYQLKLLANFLGIPNNLSKIDLSWMIAIQLMQDNFKANMPITEASIFSELRRDPGSLISILPQDITRMVNKYLQTKLWGFGANESGQLGLDDTNNRSTPTLVPNMPNAIQVACGKYGNTAVVTLDGRLWTFGINIHGELGLGDTKDRSTPTLVANLFNVVQVEYGGYHTAVVTSDGRLWTFGDNGSGQLGLGNLKNTLLPTLVPTLSNVKQVSCGGSHTAVITTDGRLWTFGDNRYGQSGLGNLKNTLVPTLVPSLSNVKQVACGDDHTAVITTDGRLWTFGSNSNGELGLGDKRNRLVPTFVRKVSNVKQVACGLIHTAVVTTNGRLWTFGSNSVGQLGLGNKTRYFGLDVGNKENIDLPTMVPNLSNVTEVACGGYHTAVVTLDSRLWTFGGNKIGQLGLYDTNNRSVPTLVPSLSNVKQVACGGNHTMVITN